MTACVDLAFTQHRGRVPRQEDALRVGLDLYQATDLPVTLSRLPRAGGLCAVADGVATSRAPGRASQAVLAALTLPEERASLLQDGWIGPRALRRHVHPHLCRQLAGDRRTRGAATTLALLEWRGERLSVLNVGDSRVYRIDPAGTWRRLSRDHTYYQSLLERGEIAPGQSLGHLYHDLEHCLRAEDMEDDFAVHWDTGPWGPGETVLLCTDGVHDSLEETHMHALYHPERPLEDQATLYREAVLAAGAPDNFSLILVRTGERPAADFPLVSPPGA